jgi:outer membrane receptor protein involved in Fe transport
LTGDSVPDPGLAKQLKLALVPNWTYSASIAYKHDMGSLGIASASVDYSWIDDRFFDVLNRVPAASYGLLNANVSLGHDTGWRITAAGRNLTNERYVSTAE